LIFPRTPFLIPTISIVVFGNIVFYLKFLFIITAKRAVKKDFFRDRVRKSFLDFRRLLSAALAIHGSAASEMSLQKYFLTLIYVQNFSFFKIKNKKAAGWVGVSKGRKGIIPLPPPDKKISLN